MGSLGPSREPQEGARPYKTGGAGLGPVLTPIFSQASHPCIQAGGVGRHGGATELKDLGAPPGVYHRTGISLDLLATVNQSLC